MSTGPGEVGETTSPLVHPLEMSKAKTAFQRTPMAASKTTHPGAQEQKYTTEGSQPWKDRGATGPGE